MGCGQCFGTSHPIGLMDLQGLGPNTSKRDLPKRKAASSLAQSVGDALLYACGFFFLHLSRCWIHIWGYNILRRKADEKQPVQVLH